MNQNYINYGAKKYCRISHGANIQKLAFVNDNTKFIILVDIITMILIAIANIFVLLGTIFYIMFWFFVLYI